MNQELSREVVAEARHCQYRTTQQATKKLSNAAVQ
jgi:hypothetical protein